MGDEVKEVSGFWLRVAGFMRDKAQGTRDKCEQRRLNKKLQIPDPEHRRPIRDEISVTQNSIFQQQSLYHLRKMLILKRMNPFSQTFGSIPGLQFR